MELWSVVPWEMVLWKIIGLSKIKVQWENKMQ
jgi:hypothetical protein